MARRSELLKLFELRGQGLGTRGNPQCDADEDQEHDRDPPFEHWRMRAGPQQQHANGQATCQTHQNDEPRMEPANGAALARLGRWEGPPGRLRTAFSELTSCALSWQRRIRRSAIVGWRRCPGAVHGVDSDLRPRHLADRIHCSDATVPRRCRCRYATVAARRVPERDSARDRLLGPGHCAHSLTPQGQS